MARDDKVAMLIDAALEAFARAGLEGARVDAIAEAAGMNKRLLYHYVGDKTALFDAAARTAVARLADGPPGEHPAAWRVLCHASAAGRCPDLTALVARLGDESPAALGRQLLAGLLPEVAAALAEPEPAGPPAAGSEAAARQRGAQPGPGQPKPRIKLRPSLRPSIAPAALPGVGSSR